MVCLPSPSFFILVRLGQKYYLMSNTLAYYALKHVNYNIKNFYNIVFWAWIITLFTAAINSVA
jgi:hypothetical protein